MADEKDRKEEAPRHAHDLYDADGACLVCRAHAEKIAAERDEVRARVRVANLDADVKAERVMREVAKEREEEAERRAKDNKYFRIYHFANSVSEGSVAACIRQLDVWTRGPEGEGHDPIEIIFTSPGGEIISGFVLFDYIQAIRAKGFHVTTGTYGMAASMAGILLQAGDVRWIGREAWLLIHQAQFGAMGTMGQVEDQVEWIKRIQKRILGIFASRASARRGSRYHGKETLVLKKIEKNWQRKDWWLSSDDCLEWGFVDEIR